MLYYGGNDDWSNSSSRIFKPIKFGDQNDLAILWGNFQNYYTFNLAFYLYSQIVN